MGAKPIATGILGDRLQGVAGGDGSTGGAGAGDVCVVGDVGGSVGASEMPSLETREQQLQRRVEHMLSERGEHVQEIAWLRRQVAKLQAEWLVARQRIQELQGEFASGDGGVVAVEIAACSVEHATPEKSAATVETCVRCGVSCGRGQCSANVRRMAQSWLVFVHYLLSTSFGSESGSVCRTDRHGAYPSSPHFGHTLGTL